MVLLSMPAKSGFSSSPPCLLGELALSFCPFSASASCSNFSLTILSLSLAFCGIWPSALSFLIWSRFLSSAYFDGPYSLSSVNRSKALKPADSNMTFLMISQDFSPYAIVSMMLAASWAIALVSSLFLESPLYPV
jgi:hypothetical protein